MPGMYNVPGLLFFLKIKRKNFGSQNVMRIFAVSNNERPHSLTKMQKDC